MRAGRKQLPLVANTNQDDLDKDGDGYNEGPIPNMDCNDLKSNINPGVIETSPANDGTDQNCDGLDLSIMVTEARFRGVNLDVGATSNLGSTANLSVKAYDSNHNLLLQGALVWQVDTGIWSNRFYQVNTNITNIEVIGVEGVVPAAVQ